MKLLLRRCPFCNGHDLAVDITSTEYLVRCMECGVTGPSGDTPRKAEEWWNGTHQYQNDSALISLVPPNSNRNDYTTVKV